MLFIKTNTQILKIILVNKKGSIIKVYRTKIIENIKKSVSLPDLQWDSLMKAIIQNPSFQLYLKNIIYIFHYSVSI